MFQMDTSTNWTVSADLIKLVAIAIAIFLIYFFSYQLQIMFAKFLKKFGEKLSRKSFSPIWLFGLRRRYQYSLILLSKSKHE